MPVAGRNCDTLNMHIKDIKAGQVFYESDMGTSVRLEALEDARFYDDPNASGGKAYAVKVKSSERELELFQAIEDYGYGLRLSPHPEYMRVK